MKLTFILLTAAMMSVHAAGLSQNITIAVKQATLEKIFQQVEEKTNYVFFYKKDDLSGTKPVSIAVSNIPIDQFIKLVLQDQPLKFSIEKQSIIISRKENSVETPVKNQPPVTGIVRGPDGKPLAGVNIMIKGTKRGTRTNDEGVFSIEAKDGDKLIVSCIGFATQEITVSFSKTLILSLAQNNSPLDEVQVIAYGTETKRFSTGAVSTVNAEEISRQPVSNPLLALQGQAPGLAVSATNGVPGSTVMVQVRGQNSLGTTMQVKPFDQPLFIIDGVPFAPQNVNINQLNNLATAQSFTGGISQATGISAFNNINPNDIESITILKDAAATSIYGSQGSNGVVLITTKRGKSGKTSFDLGVNTQFNSTARPVKFLNTQQYLQLRQEAFAADGATPSDDPFDFGYAPDLTVFDQNKYTDWSRIIAGKTTNNTDVHATVSGGSASTTFRVSAGYTRSNYNYPGNFSDQRLTWHSALRNVSADKRFTLDLVAYYGYDENKSASYGGNRGVVLAPNLPDLKDESGHLVWTYKGVPLNVQNFYSSLMQPVFLKSYTFNSSVKLSYEIIDGLTIGANMGYSRNSTNERSENPARSQEPSFAQASAAFGNSVAQAINLEPQINYQKYFGKGMLTALVGGTYRKSTNNAYEAEAYGYANDNFLQSVIGATDIYPFETMNIFKYAAGFARLKYIHDQKYILEVSGRRDGSSNFGPGRQFGNFASASAGWIFSEEKAFKEALRLISFGKLSASYGTTGGDASRAYSYQALYQNVTGVPAFSNIKPSSPYNPYNPDFSWSTKKSLNLSLDLSFLNNIISLNTTYYRNREGNQLVDYPLPVQAGFSRVFGNLDAVVQNQGWEFSIASNNVKNSKFTWTTNFNLTLNRNKLVSFPNLASSSYANKYIVGEPTSIILGYRYKGVNPTTGLYEFYDKDGNTTSSPMSGRVESGGDQVPIGNREIKYMGGLGNNFSYKNFSLFVFCQFSSSWAPNYLAGLYSYDYPGAPANQPVAILDKYWKKPGDNASIQKLASSYFSGSLSTIPPFTQSDAVYSDVNYLRVKTVSLSYTLPERFLKKARLHGASIYVNAQNLFTITNYEVGDPEQPGTFTSFPLQRIVAFGVNFKF